MFYRKLFRIVKIGVDFRILFAKIRSRNTFCNFIESKGFGV